MIVHIDIQLPSGIFYLRTFRTQLPEELTPSLDGRVLVVDFPQQRG